MSLDSITSAWLSAAQKHPAKPAFIDAADGSTITYGQLKSLALKYAGAVLSCGKAGGNPVVITVNRSPLCVAAMLGVCAAGGWYVPVDAELPAERLKTLMSVAGPYAVINAAKIKADFGDVPVIEEESLTDEVDINKLLPRDPSSPLFGIFTSGSTGMPKLVVKPFSAMAGFATVYCRTFGFDGNEVFGNQIPFYFDASTKDIYATVLLGATTVIIPAQCFSFPVSLVKTLNEYKVSTIVWVPSALGIAAKFNVFAAEKPQYLKNVLFVGERMPVKYLNVWIDNLPGTRFVNLYGSTEVAGNSCYYVINRRFEGADILPIGHEFDKNRVFILNPETKEPADEGEICVAGEGLAIGYYKDAEKTEKAFRDMTVGDFCGRVYFSGDIGRRNDAGELVCVSRGDSQIKHMGHRIELGEIESTASAIPGLDEVCCLYDAEKEKILLCFSSATDISADIRRTLSEKLPRYMLPHKYIYKAALPHNRNGKIDRAGIRAELIKN